MKKRKYLDVPHSPRKLLEVAVQLSDELYAANGLVDDRYFKRSRAVERRPPLSRGRLLTRAEQKELEALDDLRGALLHLWAQMRDPVRDLKGAVARAEKFAPEEAWDDDL